MTKPWKLKTNSSNILLVLITLILIKAEWADGTEEEDNAERVNEIANGDRSPEIAEDNVEIYSGNEEIAQYFFQKSSVNDSLIINNINQCLKSFQLVTCLKMLLLNRLNGAIKVLQDPEVINRDFVFFNGLLAFQVKNKNNTWTPGEESDASSLNDEITQKLLKLFHNRVLRLNLLSKYKLDIVPVPRNEDGNLISFDYEFHEGMLTIN